MIEQPKYFELNRGNKLPEATLYSWDNAVGDPEMFTGYLMHPKLPFSAWKDMDVGGRVMKLFGVVDYDKRIAGLQGCRRVRVPAGRRHAAPAVRDHLGEQDQSRRWCSTTMAGCCRISGPGNRLLKRRQCARPGG